eukprot:89610_1
MSSDSNGVELVLTNQEVHSAFSNEETDAQPELSQSNLQEDDSGNMLIPKTNQTTAQHTSDAAPIQQEETKVNTNAQEDICVQINAQNKHACTNSEEWSVSKSFSLTFDLYHDTDDPAIGKITQTTNEVINEESIITNISICLGFLLHEDSPLWNHKQTHHSTKELLGHMRTNHTFLERCSVFKSNYVLGVSETMHSNDKHNTIEEDILHNIMKHLDQEERQQKWQRLLEYWDSWTRNRHVKMDEFLDLQRFNWDAEYKGHVDTAAHDIDVLVDKLHTLEAAGPRIEASPTDLERMEKLRAVQNRAHMKAWLRSYKKRAADMDKLAGNLMANVPSMSNASSTLFKQIMGYNWHDDDDLKNSVSLANIPIKHWKWQHVVFWLEQKDELMRAFASVVFEWKINGEELLVMGIDQIRWLTSCCYRGKRFHKERVKDLIIEVKKQMISTMITYQYGLYHKTIRQIEDDETLRCANIRKLLKYLRPNKEQGPKAFWKMDAFYFSKIDNILAVLLAPGRCRDLWRELNPLFIFDEDDDFDANLPERGRTIRGTKQKRLSLRSDSVVERKSDEDKNVATAERDVDCIDKIADCDCLRQNCCGTFMRNFDRVYLKVICLYLIALSFGCLVVWFYMSSRSRMEVDFSMRWTSKSILARAVQNMEYEFFKPQMILNIAVGGLYSGDISIDKDQFIGNPEYDAFFAQYKAYKVTESSLYSLCMWEAANNTMICAEGDPLSIVQFDGDCIRSWSYSTATKQRNTSHPVLLPSCGKYEPASRAWYAKAQELAMNDIGWTEPYLFFNGGIGISLVRHIEYNGVEVIWLAELTTVELDAVFKIAGNTSVIGGISFLSTSRGSVIASSIGQYDLNPEFIDCCAAEDPLLVDSIGILREGADDGSVLTVYRNDSWIEQDNTVMTITSFETTYLSGDNVEYGTIAVVYDEQHLARIRDAEVATMALYIVTLSLAVIISCSMAAYLQRLQREIKERWDPTGFQIRTQPSVDVDETKTSADALERSDFRFRLDEARERQRNYIATKYDSYLVASDCILDHRTITVCSFWYMMMMFLCTFYIWQRNVDATLDDITETFLTQEYMIVADKVATLVIVAESVADIVMERFNRGDMTFGTADTIPKELDAFFANIMESFKQPNG